MKKVWASIFVLVVIVSFSGCMTTAPRGGEPEPIFIKALTERPAIIPATLAWGADGCLDAVNDKPAQKLMTVVEKAKVKFKGWAGNIEKSIVPQDAFLEFEGPTHAYFKITTRLKRPDVVAYFTKPGLMESGWVAYVDLTALTSGTYKVKTIQLAANSGFSDDTGHFFKLIDSDLKAKK